uniref:Uncharacterized protein n=1 Tax=Trichogramma kaykai TaxID=54128 RepID=A0ABD2WHE1_9HYME
MLWLRHFRSVIWKPREVATARDCEVSRTDKESVVVLATPTKDFGRDVDYLSLLAQFCKSFSSASNREHLYYIPAQQREKCRRGYIHSYLYLPSVRARSNISYARVCHKYNETRRAHLCRYSQLQRRQ